MRYPTRCSLLPALALLLAAFTATSLRAQEAEVIPPPEPRASPTMIARTMLGDTYLKVTYSSPRKRDREIFGGLVPYGEVWRTGANEATELTTTGDIEIAGHRLPAGTYALFTIPEENQWTVILNGVLGQWGAFRYNPDEDVLRFTVPVTRTPELYEAFTIEFEEAENGVNLVMTWDHTRVSIPIRPV
ncbi:DUF2911 domain-containing protein [Rhodocaloribacter litoris]|uniref:DUF2911 domain-containing protein n=1 Tax=Rhodocaloribacter litoris TaxID=2558931 RepID=UPI00142250C1|nr:DUF2911 domain-containing protein [Rhodocaloribacter litoris]QXD16635.1 DUF2911 domain-containing protein [Rhodocaloribacter litoris]GIV59368.1 MAG: hypothetical protein KatS3mg043_0457 [Rhodothermaceae bacterium]